MLHVHVCRHDKDLTRMHTEALLLQAVRIDCAHALLWLHEVKMSGERAITNRSPTVYRQQDSSNDEYILVPGGHSLLRGNREHSTLRCDEHFA